MASVDLSALRRVDNLGFSYVTGDPVRAVESPGYFLAARGHLRPGDRLFVTAALDPGRRRAAVRDYLVVAIGRQAVTLQPVRGRARSRRHPRKGKD